VVAAASASTREKGVRAKTVTAAVSASTSGEAGAKTAAAAASVTQHDYAFFTLLALFPQSRSVKLSP